ncbi:hypothetical protein [Phytohabitans rumicis]|uniref:hypothetical protein n=1 Tax=Phytohabitans rumicis TaxID=1076125 RepID=UPI001565035F|nr:hypothetical protein [Phytohabitans rumicis]
MTGLELILAALASGASELTTVAVRDAYAGLRDRLLRRLGGRTEAVQVLEAEQSSDPGVWRVQLGQDLAAVLADSDAEVLAAAREVLALAESLGAASSEFHVDARDARGVQIGDHNTQHNTFS